jgi:hypothetical protein
VRASLALAPFARARLARARARPLLTLLLRSLRSRSRSRRYRASRRAKTSLREQGELHRETALLRKGLGSFLHYISDDHRERQHKTMKAVAWMRQAAVVKSMVLWQEHVAHCRKVRKAVAFAVGSKLLFGFSVLRKYAEYRAEKKEKREFADSFWRDGVTKRAFDTLAVNVEEKQRERYVRDDSAATVPPSALANLSLVLAQVRAGAVPGPLRGVLET